MALPVFIAPLQGSASNGSDATGRVIDTDDIVHDPDRQRYRAAVLGV